MKRITFYLLFLAMMILGFASTNSYVFAQGKIMPTLPPAAGDPAGTTEEGESVNLDLGNEAVNQGLPGSANTNPEAPGGGFSKLIGSLMSFVMVIAAIMALLYMIMGALEWITASGDSGKLDKARQKIAQSIIGLIVLSSVTALFMMLQEFLGICVLPFFGGCSP